ncbi:MAG: hypothetical protein H0X39_00260 [Actinobacteria bacterium]|nr:hypothetical protein [Gemmatimonadaceae bacterium]MBA3841053.1 hypothetical protein [Actinomycetota bacterium]
MGKYKNTHGDIDNSSGASDIEAAAFATEPQSSSTLADITASAAAETPAEKEKRESKPRVERTIEEDLQRLYAKHAQKVSELREALATLEARKARLSAELQAAEIPLNKIVSVIGQPPSAAQMIESQGSSPLQPTLSGNVDDLGPAAASAVPPQLLEGQVVRVGNGEPGNEVAPLT